MDDDYNKTKNYDDINKCLDKLSKSDADEVIQQFADNNLSGK